MAAISRSASARSGAGNPRHLNFGHLTDIHVNGRLDILQLSQMRAEGAPQTRDAVVCEGDRGRNKRIGASAKTKIRRSEFGMQWNAALEAGGVLVGDEVTISLEVSLVRA